MTDYEEDTNNTTTSALSFHFERNASYAIQVSLNEHRPLLMLIQDQSDESTEWILNHFQENLSQFSNDLLNTKFINLDLIHNSKDFQLFLQIFPQFTNVKVPCVVILYSGKIVDIIDSNVTPDEFDSRLKEADNNLKNVDGAVISSQQQQQQHQQQQHQSQPYNQSSSGNTVQQNQNQSQNQQSTIQQTHTPVSPTFHSSTPTPDPSLGEPHATTTPPIPSLNSAPPPSIPNTENSANNARRYSSLKEQSAELAAKKYRENLVKQQRQDQEERERILKLLKADREERKRREENEKLGINDSNEVLPPIRAVHENLHNKKLEDSNDYMLQIKLFDGHSFRAKFNKTETLYSVREYVWAHYTEYQQLPFFFFKTIDRVTFTDTDEDKTLGQLNLNRATLIMKPLDPFAVTSGLEKKAEVNKVNAASSFSWLKNKFVGYLWGDGPGTNDSVYQSSSPLTSSTSPTSETTIGASTGISSSNIPPLQRGASGPSSSIHQRPYHDYADESESESVYQSPEFRARSSSPQPAVTGSSNFNLYGPITGSTHSVSGFNLSSMNNPIGDAVGSSSSNLHDSLSQQHPPLTNTMSSASINTSASTNSQYGSSSRNKFIHTVDELNYGAGVNREVYNGNALDLEDNNNNKKKKTNEKKKECTSVVKSGSKAKKDAGNSTGSNNTGNSSNGETGSVKKEN